MTNTQKLTTKQMIEESVEALIYLKDKMDLPAFIVALNVKFLKVAEVAKAERDKEILNLELELSDVAGSTKKYWMQLGVDRFKALLTPNKKEV